MEKESLSSTEIGYLNELRKHLHAHPELSGSEFETVATLKSFLKKHASNGYELNFGENAFAWVFNGNGTGQSIMLRADT
ncbi:MAG: amidohydrolase, partial [Bacteroidia bacterium]